jgi:hypothetical protein
MESAFPVQPQPPAPQQTPPQDPAPAQEAPALPGEEHLPPAAVSFWQQPWVQNFLPLGTSIVIHIVIIVIGVMLVVPQVKYREVSQEQYIVPEAAMIENAPVGGIPNPGLGGDPNRAAAQEKFDSNASDGFAQKPSETLQQSLMGGGVADNAASNAIAVGPNIGFGKGAGAGSGIGEMVGSGEGGGALAPFGVAGGGGGAGPKSPFMGISGNATRVAYVCDASGSMIEKMSPLKNELKKAIDVLKPIQGFSVIFFADPDEKPKALASTMLMASPDNKRRAYDFLENVTAAGATDPIPGLELALKGKPQLIYLLTDGDFPDNDAVLKRLRELNSGPHPAKINTIAFVNGRDKQADQSFEKVLQQIAKENGGVFKRVSVQDVQ